MEINTTFTTQKEYKYWEQVIQERNRLLFDSIIHEEDEEVKTELVKLYKAGQDLYVRLLSNEFKQIRQTESKENKKFISKTIEILGKHFIVQR